MDRRKFIRIGSLIAANAGLAAFVPVGVGIGGDHLGDVGLQGDDLEGRSGEDQELADVEAANFLHPMQAVQPGCFWWWFNGLVNKVGITRDLEAFKAKGIGEVLLVNSASGLGGAKMPDGVKFLSDEWRPLYRHALQEAERLGITVGVNFASGWCMGGPWIDPEHAGRWFLQSQMRVRGPQRFSGILPLPGNRDGYDKVFNPPGYKEYIDLPLEKLDYRDTAIVAFPVSDEAVSRIRGKRAKLLPAKTNRKDASNFIKSKDLMEPVQESWAASPDDKPITPAAVIDLTDKVGKDGSLQWDVPAGDWIILRTGHRMTGSKLMIAQPEADGLSVDWLSSKPVDLQFEHLGKIILEDAGRLKGKTLKYLSDDSFEDGFPNWTEAILEKFAHYRGYDARPYLPVLNGFIVGSADISDRFLHDYRKTVADCMADEHYGHFARRCHEHGVLVHNESAGPSRSGTMCMDGLKNLGKSDYPTGEFWLGLRHDEEGGLDEKQSYGVTRLEGGQNKVTKMVASAAHIYGKKLASAEAFTSNRHWLDYPGNMKQAADRAFCEGINRFLIHAITATRPEDGKPGYEYGAGTHFNPNVTWWDKSGPFLDYLARCQYMLQQGMFVADILYYNGDGAPNIVSPKHIDTSLGSGYDYDTCNEEVLLTRLSVKGGRIYLPDGMNYGVLVLPEDNRMPAPVARAIRDLVAAGAMVAGPKPVADPGLSHYPACDGEVKAIGNAVWGDCDGVAIRQHRYGKGQVYWNTPLREILANSGVGPDLMYAEPDVLIDFIHRRVGEKEVYFLANRNNRHAILTASFRVKGKVPELWDPVSGEVRGLKDFREVGGGMGNAGGGERTEIPMAFFPFQSMFIVFAKPGKQGGKGINFPVRNTLQVLEGPWTVHFDEQWGGPSSVRFETLEDWTKRPEEGIRYYSGTAMYGRSFDLVGGMPSGQRLFLDLGVVKNIASVKLNGKSLGIIWTSPWNVEITGVVKDKDNLLEIEVVNLWPNRLIGDAALPPEKRLTHTNISFDKTRPLLPSGLLGPVIIQNAIYL